VKKEGLPLKVANMDFDLCVYDWFVEDNGLQKVLDKKLFFWIIWLFTYFWYLIFKFWKYLWELQGDMCLNDYPIVFIFVKNKRRESQGVPPT
jgi:hypothetical protein